MEAAAQAVTAYYGVFPVLHALIRKVPVSDERGIVQGTTWGDRNAFRNSRAFGLDNIQPARIYQKRGQPYPSPCQRRYGATF